MKVDMSPEAITNRLKIMEQLWELSINLMQSKEISDEKNWHRAEENENRNDLEKLQNI